MPGIDGFVIKPGDHLGQVHAVPGRDFCECVPERVLHANTGDHAVDAQGMGAADPEFGIRVDEEFTHGVVLVNPGLHWQPRFRHLSSSLKTVPATADALAMPVLSPDYHR